MQKSNLVHFAELFEHAETLGYNWNDACNFLDEFRPTGESSIYYLQLSDLNKKKTNPNFDQWLDTEYPDNVNEVLTSFLNKHDVIEIDIYWS